MKKNNISKLDSRSLVSIIIPVYNAEKFINDTINTVLNQTYENWELILVDDCSADKSVEVINKYLNHKIHVYKLEKNSGAAIARNTGIKAAKGKYICFLDADDLWEKDKIEKQVKFMKENNCAFSFTGYEFTDSNGNPNGKKVYVPDKINYKQAIKNTIICTITVMFDMDKLNKDDIYMPNVKSEDSATWWKVLKKVDYAYGMKEILSYYRRGIQTKSSNKFKVIFQTWDLYRNVEHLNFAYSVYCFVCYIIHAILRRI